jgi:hypothetical protein
LGVFSSNASVNIAVIEGEANIFKFFRQNGPGGAALSDNIRGGSLMDVDGSGQVFLCGEFEAGTQFKDV